MTHRHELELPDGTVFRVNTLEEAVRLYRDLVAADAADGGPAIPGMPAPKARQACSSCGGVGHNVRTCSARPGA
jgi:hypothetical protein